MDPTLAVQVIVLAALKASTALTTITGHNTAGQGIYIRVPPTAVLPYANLTGWQEIDDGTDCMDASEINFDVQCYSNTVGREQVAAMAKAAKDALNRLNVSTASHTNVEIQHNSTLYFLDDGLTSRAVVSFRALVDGAA